MKVMNIKVLLQVVQTTISIFSLMPTKTLVMVLRVVLSLWVMKMKSQDSIMVQNTRVGIAPSLAFGLGTENRATLSYYFIKSNDEPDSGIPFNIDWRKTLSSQTRYLLWMEKSRL
jgi:hypothetical protein